MNGFTWQEARSLRYAALLAGSSAGVYLIGKTYEIRGVPLSYEWVYVGRSNNLARRFTEHLPTNEINPGLRDWLRKAGGVIAIRFTILPESISIRIERELIRSLSPKHNQIMFKLQRNGENHEYLNSDA